MDLVDEEHVTGLQVGQNRSKIAFFFNRGSGHDMDFGSHLACDDLGKRRFPEARRACQEHMVECISALFRGLDEKGDLLPDRILSDVFLEHLGAQGLLDLDFT
jgi:hypothetical protein